MRRLRRARDRRPWLGQAEAVSDVGLDRARNRQKPGAKNLLTFMGNAVSGAITIMITTHPFVPNFAGEVDFSPDKLGPVTTFRAHSVG